MLSAVACAAWSGYGIILHDWPVLASSIWGFATSVTILLLTMLRYSGTALSHKLALTETLKARRVYQLQPSLKVRAPAGRAVPAPS